LHSQISLVLNYNFFYRISKNVKYSHSIEHIEGKNVTTLPELDFDLNHDKPLLIVISGLSGAGKDSVVEKLKQRNFPFHFVITATSRAPRSDEVDGVHYFFYSKDKFKSMINDNEFIEYALVYEQYKGVPKSQVDQALSSGKDVVMRVDYQGAKTIKSLYPEAILIFVMPENTQAWCDRLIARGQDSDSQMKIRFETAKKEIQAAKEYFNYVVTNPKGQLDYAADTVMSIIKAEHQRIRP